MTWQPPKQVLEYAALAQAVIEVAAQVGAKMREGA